MGRLIWSIIGMMVLLVAPLTASRGVIQLVDSIAVDAPTITLGEIAVIDTPEPALREALTSLRIGDTPRIGDTTLVSSYKIQSLLKNANIDDVTIRGEQSKVKTRSRIVQESDLYSMVEEWVKGKFASDIDVDLNFVRMPDRWAIPAGDSVNITIYTSARHLADDVNLKIRAVADNRVLATTHARIKVSLLRNSVVALRPIKRGSVITNEDVVLRKNDVTDANGMEIAKLEDIVGMEATNNISVGDLLTVRDCTAPVVIDRGSLNRILVVNGNIKMTIVGAKALEDGRVDDTIMFSNPMNNGTNLCAKVIREGLAVVKIN